MATNTMDWDMDTDAHPIEDSHQVAASTEQLNTNEAVGSNLTDIESTLAPTKVHIRGLDTLTTKEIKEYVREYYGEVDRVEWIDDTSANLLFSSDSIANDAMCALSVDGVDPTVNPSTEVLFDAKPVPGKLEISLKIRPAFISDKKEAGAAQRSRFYLLNPEYDPEERARRRENRDRDRHNGRRYDDRRSQRNNRRRDDDDEIERFSDSFYDDGEVDPPRSRHRERSYSRSRSRSRTRGQNQGKELFPDRSVTKRSSGRDRDRSASPIHDSDENMDVDSRGGRPGRNQDRERFIKHQQRLNNRAKELFPLKRLADDKGSSAQLDRLDRGRLDSNDGETGSYMGYAIKGSASKPPVKELFLAKATSNSTTELFADKLERRGKPRERAEDRW